jgi:hypothetical protein
MVREHNHSMRTPKKKDDPAWLWERVVQFQDALSPTAARSLLKIRYSQGDLEQMNALAAKARAGTLTVAEQLHLENYERLGCLLDILHSRARAALFSSKRHKTI